MSTINLPVLLAQLPHLSKLSSAEQFHPEAQAAFTEQLAREARDKERQQVQKTDPQEKLVAVKDEGGGSGGGRHASGERKEKKPQEEMEEQVQARSPWAGNIVNTKV
ncbi:MAG: hypothetical protein SVS15_08630 [Thermodesulfobacteriota bacterium]|nr:hypothetical protein [Thermodesulfobacteriota bacterium]